MHNKSGYTLIELVFVCGVVMLLFLPPMRDLASLVDAEAALQRLEVQTDEQSLLALLQETEGTADRSVAASPAPDSTIVQKLELQKDYGCVKKLFAIRMLEQMKSRKAIPVLKSMAQSRDVTLRDASAQAIAVIEGKEIPCHDGKASLRMFATIVPEDAEFVLALDCTQGRRERTVSEYLNLLETNLRGLTARLGGDGQEALERIEDALIDALSVVGNVRIDSLTIFSLPGSGGERGHHCLALAGFYDPGRVGKACGAVFDSQRTWDRGTVFHTGGDGFRPAVWLLDDDMVLIYVGLSPEKKNLDHLLAGLKTDGVAPAPGLSQPAMQIVLNTPARIAASWRPSDSNRKALAMKVHQTVQMKMQSLQARPPGLRKDAALAACQVILNASNAELFVFHQAPDGAPAGKFSFSDEGSATQFHESLSAFHSPLTQVAAEEMGAATLEENTAAQRDEKELVFWESALEGKDVTVRVNVVALTRHLRHRGLLRGLPVPVESAGD